MPKEKVNSFNPAAVNSSHQWEKRMKEERKVSPAGRLGATYVTVRIILPVIAEILPLRVEVKPEWLRLTLNATR